METNSYDLSESTMNPVEKPEDDSDILTFSPTESDMDIVQSDSVIASGAVTSNDAKGPKLSTVSAAPSLVKNADKSIRDLRAMVEEIQQVCATNNLRHAETERQLFHCRARALPQKVSQERDFSSVSSLPIPTQ